VFYCQRLETEAMTRWPLQVKPLDKASMAFLLTITYGQWDHLSAPHFLRFQFSVQLRQNMMH
jgi:hypothetical protein